MVFSFFSFFILKIFIFSIKESIFFNNRLSSAADEKGEQIDSPRLLVEIKSVDFRFRSSCNRLAMLAQLESATFPRERLKGNTTQLHKGV